MCLLRFLGYGALAHSECFIRDHLTKLHSVLLNIGHGATIAEIGTDFRACRHNKAEVNKIFYGGRFVHGRLRWQNGGGKNMRLKKQG